MQVLQVLLLEQIGFTGEGEGGGGGEGEGGDGGGDGGEGDGDGHCLETHSSHACGVGR